MKRKVSKIGPATLMVSLPSKWVKKYGVKKGDEVEINETKGNIVISSGKSNQEIKKASLVIEKKDYFFKRMLIWHYKQGYDELELHFKDELPISTIKEKLDELLGFEIVEVKQNYCKLRCISTVKEDEFEPMLKRIFILTSSMLKDTMLAIEKNDFEKFHELSVLEKTHDKLTNFCQRIINTVYENREMIAYQNFIIDMLEQIADQLDDMCKRIHAGKIKTNEDIKYYFNVLIELFDELNILYYNRRHDKLLAFRTKRLELFDDLFALLEKNSGKQSIIIHYLLNILELMMHIETAVY